MGKLSDLLNKQDIILLDSAMGTELQDRGVDVSLPLWSARAIVDNPDIIKAIHLENIESGADIITTNTFRTQRITFEKADYSLDGKNYGETAFEFTRKAVNIAKETIKAARKNILLAGGIAPIEDCYEPGLVPETDILSTEQNEHIDNLIKAGVDILIAETMNNIREISVVLNQIHQTGYEYCISFVCKNENELFSGETIVDAMKIINKFDPQVIMTNCVHPGIGTKIIEKLKNLTDKPFGIYCNVGDPSLFYKGRFEVNVSADEYYKFAVKWKGMGVKVIGGCCGTSPEYIKKLSALKD